jgi:hypothetical protein
VNTIYALGQATLFAGLAALRDKIDPTNVFMYDQQAPGYTSPVSVSCSRHRPSPSWRPFVATYTIYLRSFAPWRQFGALIKQNAIPMPAIVISPPTMFGPGVSFVTLPLPFGGAFHGDGRGFSLDTDSPSVTARVNALLEVDLNAGTAGQQKAWCDESRGPWMGVGFDAHAVGTPTTEFSVSKQGQSVTAVIAYGAANPLVTGAPDIDARGEFLLSAGAGNLTIVSTVTGDQFPACESFIEDARGTKLFLGGFAPENKEQIARLFGGQNKPKKVWFESEVVVSVDASGLFKQLRGGGSGSNVSGPACGSLELSPAQWNASIMNSIPMPPDAR